MDTLIYQIEKYSRLRPRSVSDECSPAPPKRAKKGGRDGWVHLCFGLECLPNGLLTRLDGSEEPRIELVLGIHAHTVTVQIVWEPVGSGRMVLVRLHSPPGRHSADSLAKGGPRPRCDRVVLD